MKVAHVAMFWAVIFLSFPFIADAQEAVRLEIVRQEKMTPFYTHLGKIDRKVYFRLVNASQKAIIVYGSRFDDLFRPGGYFLIYDERSGKFKYPTRDNKPLEWNKRDSLEKQQFILCPGASLESNDLFSSETDSKHLMKATAFVSYDIGKDPFEIVSPEFRIE